MSDVIALDEYRPQRTGYALCVACLHEWLATAPINRFELECPECGFQCGTFVSDESETEEDFDEAS